jgi:hypothetical protein
MPSTSILTDAYIDRQYDIEASQPHCSNGLSEVNISSNHHYRSERVGTCPIRQVNMSVDDCENSSECSVEERLWDIVLSERQWERWYWEIWYDPD